MAISAASVEKECVALANRLRAIDYLVYRQFDSLPGNPTYTVFRPLDKTRRVLAALCGKSQYELVLERLSEHQFLRLGRSLLERELQEHAA